MSARENPEATHSSDETRRRAELQRAVYARPDGATNPAAARDELDRLELLHRSADSKPARALESSPATGRPSTQATDSPPRAQEDSALSGAPAPAKEAKEEARAASRRLGRRLIIALAVFAALVLAGAAAAALAPHPNPLAIFDKPEDELSTLLSVPDWGFYDLHRIGQEQHWTFYAARNHDNSVCLLITLETAPLGANCVPDAEFRLRGIAVSAPLDPTTHRLDAQASTTYVFIWDQQGNLHIEQ